MEFGGYSPVVCILFLMDKVFVLGVICVLFSTIVEIQLS